METEEESSTSLLIVDDDFGDRKLIRRLLKRSGSSYSVAEATRLDEALTCLEGRSFDCAIIDYQLPGTDGLEGVKLLHEMFPYLGIILMTGQGDDAVASTAFRHGASDYISKSNINTVSLNLTIANVHEKVTLRKRMDMQRQALESFSETLVHDLKGPLVNIQLIGQLMGEAIESGDHEELTKFQTYMEAAGNRVIELIDTLQDYNVSNGRNVVFEAVPLEDVLQHAIENLGTKAASATVTHSTLPTVSGNAPQLTQLLQNLIGNGVKYCDNEVPAIHVDAQRAGGSWRIGVKDNGIGIPGDNVEDVFEPFRRLDNSTKVSGTGLGLATCKRIVERHGGRIWCESMEGGGTQFFFTVAGLAEAA